MKRDHESLLFTATVTSNPRARAQCKTDFRQKERDSKQSSTNEAKRKRREKTGLSKTKQLAAKVLTSSTLQVRVSFIIFCNVFVSLMLAVYNC